MRDTLDYNEAQNNQTHYKTHNIVESDNPYALSKVCLSVYAQTHKMLRDQKHGLVNNTL